MTRAARSSFWHAYADMKSVTDTGELVIARGEGSYVFDEDGRRYLDLSASLWYCLIGRRIFAALATLTGALLTFAAAAPAALADHVPPAGGAGPVSGVTRTVPWPKTPAVPASYQVHTVVVGGMPGWQIALIAAGAALAAAAIAVLLDRAWAARKAHATTA
jgi:hypothetical protein